MAKPKYSGSVRVGRDRDVSDERIEGGATKAPVDVILESAKFDGIKYYYEELPQKDLIGKQGYKVEVNR